MGEGEREREREGEEKHKQSTVETSALPAVGAVEDYKT